MSKKVTFRSDDEVDAILDLIPAKQLSDYIRQAIKFYYHWKDKKTLEDAISELSQITSELQKVTQNLSSQGFKPTEQIEQTPNDNKEEDFSALLLNIGLQFESWGQGQISFKNEENQELETPVDIIADDELEF